MRNKSEIDSLYKSLTKAKFKDLLFNLENCNIALAHLAYACHTMKGMGSMQIPLERHPEKIFNFKIMANKVTKERMMTIEILDEKTETSH